MNTINNATATSRNGLGAGGFGFLTISVGETEVWFSSHMLDAAGFAHSDIKAGDEVLVDYINLPDGRRRCKRIHRIGDKLASIPPAEPKRQVRRDRGKPAYQPTCFKSTEVDKGDGWRAVKVTSVATGETEHYVLFKKKEGGGETSNTFLTLAALRKVVGKTIVPPVVEGHGIKTNVVSIKSAAKPKDEPSKGKSTKKKAA